MTTAEPPPTTSGSWAVSLRDAVDRSERLIDGLLVLARSEQGNLAHGPGDLAAAALALDQVGSRGDRPWAAGEDAAGNRRR